ncbi:hypothetical protein Sjap_016071 [Stephania japonica]|uniref:BHLH domain-containing protein n=1 Tax=Stephania japonica TaxID=461633 RepID=A0AAP0IKB8_9MAGN
MARGGSSSLSVAGRERKDVEKIRRIRMKNLFLQLESLIIPPNYSKKGVPINELVDHATRYIAQKQEKVEGMKNMKEKLQLCNEAGCHKNIIEEMLVLLWRLSS